MNTHVAAAGPEPKRPSDNDPASVFAEHARWVEGQLGECPLRVGDQPRPATHTKPFSNGNFLLWRKAGAQLRKGVPGGTGGNPRFRHPTVEAAEAEAQRLLGLFPESTFIILQEVARVRVKEAEA